MANAGNFGVDRTSYTRKSSLVEKTNKINAQEYKSAIAEVEDIWMHDVYSIDNELEVFKLIRNISKKKENNLYQLLVTPRGISLFDVPSRRTKIQLLKDEKKAPLVSLELKDAEMVTIPNPMKFEIDKKNTREHLNLDSEDMDFIIQFSWNSIVDDAVKRELTSRTDLYFAEYLMPKSTAERLKLLTEMGYQFRWIREMKFGEAALIQYLQQNRFITEEEITEIIENRHKKHELLRSTIKASVRIKSVDELIVELHELGWNQREIWGEFQRKLGEDKKGQSMSKWTVDEVSMERIERVIKKHQNK